MEVAAGSLYEAAALGLRAFRSSTFGGGFGPGVTAVLTVSVKREEGRYQVPVRQVKNWLRSNGKSPREQALKQRLRGMLGGSAG